MAYLSPYELEAIGFKSLGDNVKISDKASIYDPDKIEIGSNSRIDDFCILSGSIKIGKFCHFTPMCLIAGGEPGVFVNDFCTLAYGVKIFAQSDDYSGKSMVNSLIPKKFKEEFFEKVVLKNQVVVGSGSIVFPGVIVEEGCSIGAMTLVNKSTDPWGIYFGTPAKRVKERKKDLLEFEKQFLQEQNL